MINNILKKWRDDGYHYNYGSEIIKKFLNYALRQSTYTMVLDVGCGDGRDLLIAKKLFPLNNIHLYGIGESVVDNTTMSNVDLESEYLPYENSKFDVVICNQVLEHLKNWIWTLHEIVRVTKLGGFIIIGVPNLSALHCRLQLLFGLQPSCIYADDAHVRGFAASEILRIVQSLPGLELVFFKGSNMYGLPPILANTMGRIFPKLAVSNFYLIRKTNDHVDAISLLVNKNIETRYFTGQ